jgi:type I restriction enzyme R subunit
MKTLVSVNFGFLEKREPPLARYGALAERFVFEDPETALIKIRQLIEGIANLTATYTDIPNYDTTTLADLINAFRSKGVIAQDLADLWHTIRKEANAAAHNTKQFTQSEALTALKYTRTLAVWFHRSFGRDPSFKPGPFVPPEAPKDASAELKAELDAVRKEMTEKLSELEAAKLIAKDYEAKALKAYADNEALLSLAEEAESRAASEREEKDALNQRLLELKNATEEKTDEEIVTLIHQAEKASRELELSEADTRKIIDAQLCAVGWEADTQRLDYRKGARPQKGKFLAIAEWPTESGPADYVLFDGLMPLAVVEAKRRNRNVSSYIGTQATRYSQGFLTEGGASAHEKEWGAFRVPFLFSANGRPYLEQIREESGIWFRDARRSVNLSRPLASWYSPEGLRHLLKQDEDLANAALKAEPLDFLPLHPYQRDAVSAVENAIASERRTALVAMATGTGKTRVCVCLIYRLLKAKKFRRALFLVDRTSLGEQALDENFKQIKLDGGRPFSDIYEVKELKDIKPETDTKLHIATVQGMMKRVLYPSDDSPPPSVDTYDLIVIDECHRGYTLDKDLSDNELNFRSEEEYLSKYRRVIEYFDAVKVGVTATPAPHTTQIFGHWVYRYSYRDAVIDDVLVDHLPPYRILTRLGEDGITWQAGEGVEVYQPKTGQVDLFNTPDEINLEIEDFNRSVITESFNRAVCSALAREIDPLAPGKTLVYCVDDFHADMITRLLKEAFQEAYGEVEDEAVVKITGAPKTDRPLELLKRYKNEKFPSVAVTVDYLTTGVDVPGIVNLVFIRRIRSRILYEQMLGRATRKCPDLYGSGQDKDAFRIFDAVDLYAALEVLNTMRPVVAQPTITFETLLEELDRVGSAEERQEVYEQLVAKLNRRLKRISPERAGELEAATGVSVEDLSAHVRKLDPEAAKEYFKDKGGRVASILDATEGSNSRPRLISHHPDEVLRIERGYGNFDKPEDYLTAFANYLSENKNKIPALIVVTTRPSKLTRKDLRDLRLALDRAGFPEKALDSAYQETAHQTAASIIGYIRCAALGSPLVPYEQRVARAMQKIYNSKSWHGAQLNWLKRFEKQLRLEVVLDGEALDAGQFQTEGGFARINKIFAGQAEQLLTEIHEEIWKDVA